MVSAHLMKPNDTPSLSKVRWRIYAMTHYLNACSVDFLFWFSCLLTLEGYTCYGSRMLRLIFFSPTLKNLNPMFVSCDVCSFFICYCNSCQWIAGIGRRNISFLQDITPLLLYGGYASLHRHWICIQLRNSAAGPMKHWAMHFNAI